MSSRGRANIDSAGGQAYSAAAMSLVFHTASPLVPTFRADVRYLEVVMGGRKSCVVRFYPPPPPPPAAAAAAAAVKERRFNRITHHISTGVRGQHAQRNPIRNTATRAVAGKALWLSKKCPAFSGIGRRPEHKSSCKSTINLATEGIKITTPWFKGTYLGPTALNKAVTFIARSWVSTCLPRWPGKGGSEEVPT